MTKLLDCTLRDGGLCLEDMTNYDANTPRFSFEQREKISCLLNESDVDIIEIGSIEISDNDKKGFAIYQSVEEASCAMPKFSDKYAVLYRGPDTPVNRIPEWNETLARKVRVIIRYSELKKSIDFCAALAKKGYQVFIQPMVTLRYADEELDYMIHAANNMNAYALYFVDSYGSMDYKDVDRLFSFYDRTLSKDVFIGFHAHNNKNMAFANVLRFMSLAEKAGRDVIVDSTCLGMGQGAGNLQTELIVPYLNERFNNNYAFDSVLAVCDIVDGINPDNLWGYSLYRLLPALYNTAYKYAVSMRLKYKMSFVEINRILKSMPDNLRQRYTAENLEKLLWDKKA